MRIAALILSLLFMPFVNAAAQSAVADSTVAQAEADSAKTRRHTPPDLSLGIARRNADSTRTRVFGIGLSGRADTLRGVSLTVLGSVYGVANGVQLSGMGNYASVLRGVQLSSLFNVAAGGMGHGAGSPRGMRGVQLSLGSNIAMGVERGVQLSVLANVTATSMRGVQIGGFNYADTLTGPQIGIINVARSHPGGVQIGLVNYTRDTRAKKIGLVNINPTTQVDVMVAGGYPAYANAALRFRNRSTYSLIGIGMPYAGLDGRFSGALTYRLGQYFRLSDRWSLGGDIGFSHIESFDKNEPEHPDRLFSLHAIMQVDYRLTKRLSLFAAAGYGDTRHYHRMRHFRDDLILQGGIAVRWNHNVAALADLVSLEEEAEAPHGAQDQLIAWNHGRKNYWMAAAQATGINVLVHCFDRFVLQEDFAKVTFKTIGHNFRHGFVWDNDQFSTNLFAHPYHGNLYFNSARSNGLGFWESAPYALGGSLMWEFCGEREPPAINDLMATTFGGICIGEVAHRVSELVLDESAHGFRRFLREAAATVINPMGGFNRIVSGEAWHVKSPSDARRPPLDLSVSVGSRYLSDDGAMFRGEFNPYVNIFLEYGDPLNADGTRPFDFFSFETTFGLSGNQPLINRLHIVGRLWGRALETSNDLQAEFGFFQHFNYYDSKPVKDGTQLTPYRISEAAAAGPGMILRFPKVGVLDRLEQRLFLSGILLGGTKSDYYNVIDRDYNMGSGFSVKTKTQMEFHNFGRLIIHANYYRIFTWKGYEHKDLSTIDPLYLNAQGDKGNAGLFELTPMWELDMRGPLSVVLCASYFVRNTHYTYHPDVNARTFETRLGLTCHF